MDISALSQVVSHFEITSHKPFPNFCSQFCFYYHESKIYKLLKTSDQNDEIHKLSRALKSLLKIHRLSKIVWTLQVDNDMNNIIILQIVSLLFYTQEDREQ